MSQTSYRRQTVADDLLQRAIEELEKMRPYYHDACHDCRLEPGETLSDSTNACRHHHCVTVRSLCQRIARQLRVDA